MRRWVVGGVAAVAVVAVIAVLAAGGLSTGSRPGGSPTPLPPVPLPDRVVAEARAVPAAWAAVGAAAPGLVARVAVAARSSIVPPGVSTAISPSSRYTTLRVCASTAATSLAT